MAFFDADVNHGLRIRLPIGANGGKVLIQGLQCRQNLQRGNDAVAGIVFVHTQNMAAGFAANQPTALVELFQHIAVAHFGAAEINALLFQSNFHRHIGHHCTHHAADFHAFVRACFGNHINQAVAVIHFAIAVNHHQTVAIAIQGNAVIGFILQHSRLQSFRMGRTTFLIDVVAVWLITDTDHLRAQLVEYFRRNCIACTIGGIDHQFQTAQVQMVWESGFTELDIAVIRTINPARTAQTAGRLGFHFFIDFGFDFQLDFIAQLHTAFGKEFNAVVGINVMGGRNHHTGRQT